MSEPPSAEVVGTLPEDPPKCHSIPGGSGRCEVDTVCLGGHVGLSDKLFSLLEVHVRFAGWSRWVRAAMAVSLLLGATGAGAQSPGQVRVWVELVPGRAAVVRDAVVRAGGLVHHEFDDLRALAISVPTAALAGLSRNPNVVKIETDPERELDAQSIPYGIDQVKARDIWDANRDGVIDSGAPTGEGIKVCVIDSGIQASHEDLSALSLTGESGSSAPWNVESCGHGTHVTGTIAAVNNTVGVVGVSPGRSPIHVVRVFGDSCSWAYSSDLVYAARRCQAAGAKVINMSLGGSYASSYEQSAFQTLYDQGVLSIAAAGNDGSTGFSYPASYSSVVSVAAVNSSGSVASFSQKNSQVELSAGGVNVLSTVPPNGYASYSGTSMATPHVAGVAALIWSANPAWTAAQVRTALQATARDLGVTGRDTSYGFGLVQAPAALAYLQGGSGGGGGGGGDTTPPVISSVGVTKTPKTTQFTIRWSTNEASDTVVRFTAGLSGSYADTRMVTQHAMTFSGKKKVRYTYYVSSADATGNRSESGPFSFTY